MPGWLALFDAKCVLCLGPIESRVDRIIEVESAPGIHKGYAHADCVPEAEARGELRVTGSRARREAHGSAHPELPFPKRKKRR